MASINDLRASRAGISAIAVAALFFTAGCPATGSGAAPVELTDMQKQAVEDGMKQLIAVVEAQQAGLPATDQLDLSDGATIGTCPAVSLTIVEGMLQFVLDYGDGCMNDVHGDDVLRGILAVTANAVGRTFSMVFDEISVDGRSVDGVIDLLFARSEASGSAEATFNVTTSEVGTAEGALTVVVGPEQGAIAWESGAYTVTKLDATTYEATCEQVTFHPLTNGNLFPDGGSATFVVPNDGVGPETLTIAVTFSEQTPVDGTVQVAVGSAAAVNYQIPGVGSSASAEP